MLLKQSTAVVIEFGPFLDKTDGVTLETGLVTALDHASTGILLSKNGGTLTIRHATVTASSYDAYGCYKVTLDTTDTGTLGSLRVIFSEAATCLPVWADFQVVPANIYDSLVLGSDLVDVSVTQLLGTAWLTPAVAGTPDVNMKLISGDATAADNAEAFFDGTGYAGTNNVIPLVTVLTTYTGNTPQTGDAYALIGAAGAGLTALASQASVNTLDDFVDTEVAAIKAKTDSLTFTVANQIDSNVIDWKGAAAPAMPANFAALSIDASGRVTLVPAQIVVKKNTALAGFPFLMVDSSDHITPKTGLTITATRSLNGAAFGACANSAAELASGIYVIDLAATDLNANTVTLLFTATGADARYVTILTQP